MLQFHNDISKHKPRTTHKSDEVFHLKAIVQELTDKIANQDETMKEFHETVKRQEAIIKEPVESDKKQEEYIAERRQGKYFVFSYSKVKSNNKIGLNRPLIEIHLGQVLLVTSNLKCVFFRTDLLMICSYCLFFISSTERFN